MHKLIKFIIPDSLNKDWTLYLSAVLTWAAISYFSLIDLSISPSLFIQLVLLLGFITLFFSCIALAKAQQQAKAKTIVLIEAVMVLTLIALANPLAPILLCLVATQLPPLYNRKQALFGIVLINLAFVAIQWWQLPQFNVFSLIIYFLLQLFAFSAIEIMLREENLSHQLALINNELIATRFILKETTEQQERLRISRDLHDIIGHHITALSLNLQVLTHQAPKPMKAQAEQCFEQSQQVLSQIRQVVKDMRQATDLDVAQHLLQMVEAIPHCQLTIDSFISIDSLNLKHQLLRCLQEGISNGLRHAKADHFVLSATKENQQITITLTNNGLPYQQQSFGSGLTGMQERLTAYAGSVSLQAQTQGSNLIIKVKDTYD